MNSLIIKSALQEDIGCRDITTNSLIPKEKKLKAVITSKEEAVVCGLKVVKEVFSSFGKNVRIKANVKDGKKIKTNTVILEISGSARTILSCERVALNFLSHLSGIATQTRRFVDRCRPYNSKIFDTRKTTPGLRALEKYAVKCAGGFNHRFGLWDMVLIKDNHKEIKSLNASKRSTQLKIKEIILEARRKNKNKKVEIEVESIAEFQEALLAKPDIIMLDNVSLGQIRKAIILRKGSLPLIEVSGNVNLKNVRSIAQAGIDRISVGSLTHSVKAIDFSLEVIL